MPTLTPRQLARIAYRRLPALGPITMDALQRRRHSERREPAHLNVMTSLGGNDADVLQVMLLLLLVQDGYIPMAGTPCHYYRYSYYPSLLMLPLTLGYYYLPT